MGAIGLLGLSRSRRGPASRCSARRSSWCSSSRPVAGSLLRLRALLAGHPGAAALHPPVGRRDRRPAPARPAPGSARPGHPGGGAGHDRPRGRPAAGLGQRRSASSPTCSRRRSCRWPPSPGSPRPSCPWLARPGRRARRVGGVLPTQGIAQVARRFAEVPGGTLPWPDGAPGALLLAALTVAVLFTGRALAAGVRGPPVLVARRRAGLARRGLTPTRTVTWPPDGLAGRRRATSVRGRGRAPAAGRTEPSSSTPAPTRLWSTAA